MTHKVVHRDVVHASALALPQRAAQARHDFRSTVRSYIALTKPRIISLLLITTVPTMIVANNGMPSLTLILLTLVGGTLAAAGANTINCYIDRDIDRIMVRTRGRPLAAGSIEPERALLFGLGLGAASFATLALGVNLLSAGLALAALMFYVFVYTIWLKRSTVQNIVIGGAAGAMPPLVGWAAVTGTLGWPALLLFGIIFLWTPPHFWALAMRYRNDYARAGVPMLPVVRGEGETARQIVVYSVALVSATLLLVPVAAMGVLYFVTALVLGGWFVWLAVRLFRERSPQSCRALFLYSLAYLALLYISMGADQLIV